MISKHEIFSYVTLASMADSYFEGMKMLRLFVVFLKPVLNNEDTRQGLRCAEETGGVILMRKNRLGWGECQ